MGHRSHARRRGHRPRLVACAAAGSSLIRDGLGSATPLRSAQNDDVIMIAGKGHENYQEINGTKYHFDDKEIVEELLGEL